MQPPRRSTLAAAVALCATLLAACGASAPSRTLYQWTDAAGDTRYTPYPDRIPEPQRHTSRPVTPGATAIENAIELPVVHREPGATDVPPIPVSTPALETPADDPSSLDARILALEARIAADQETLKTLIADPEGAAGLRESPALREISERLPALQRELEGLLAERDEDATPDAS